MRLGLPEGTASPGVVAVRVSGLSEVAPDPLTALGVPPAQAPMLHRGARQYMPFFPEDPSPDEIQSLFSKADPGHVVWPVLDLGSDVAKPVPWMDGALYPRKDEPLMLLLAGNPATVATADGLVFSVPAKHLTTTIPAKPLLPTKARNVLIPSFDVAPRWVAPADAKLVDAHTKRRAKAMECAGNFEDDRLGGVRGRSIQWFRTTYVNGKAVKVEDYNEVVRGQAWKKCGLGKLETDEAKVVAALETAFRKRATGVLARLVTRFEGATTFEPGKAKPQIGSKDPYAAPAPPPSEDIYE